jgi:hypothetical protein
LPICSILAATRVAAAVLFVFAMSIVLFVAVKLLESFLMLFRDVSVVRVRHRTVISMVRVEVIVDMPLKIRGTMEPGTGTDEDTAAEPFGAIVTCWRAGIRCVIVVPVGANRSNPDRNGNLGASGRRGVRR